MTGRIQQPTQAKRLQADGILHNACGPRFLLFGGQKKTMLEGNFLGPYMQSCTHETCMNQDAWLQHQVYAVAGCGLHAHACQQRLLK